MITLQQKLRQLRGWQRMTLASCETKAEWLAKKLAAFESGEKAEVNSALVFDSLLIRLAHTYGLVPRVLKEWLEDERKWRAHADTGNSYLPRMAQFVSRSLPEAAHNLYCSGFCVVDLETTGKDPHNGTQICEITILDTDGVVLLNSLVNPGIHIPDDLTANVHGISDEMVASAPTFREIGPEIARLIDNQVVIIFNAGYDGWLLDRLFIESGLDMPDFQEWCLMKAYADHMKFPGKYGNHAWQSLSAACEQQGVEQDESAHRTLADTTATWKLLQSLALQHKA